MRIIHHFFLLMWKNLTIHRRKFKATASECFLPTLFAFGLLLLKLASHNKSYNRSYYEKEPVGLPQFPKVFGFVPESEIGRSLAESVVDRHLQYLGSMMPTTSPPPRAFVMPTIKGKYGHTKPLCISLETPR